MPSPGPRRALQPVEPGSVVLGPLDVLLAAKLAWAGLDALERRDGATPPAFRTLAEELCDAAEQARKHIETQARRSGPVASTTRARTGFPHGSSDPETWPTTKDAAATYGVSRQYLARLAQSARITAKWRGGGYRLDPSSLAVWAVGRTVKSDDQAA